MSLVFFFGFFFGARSTAVSRFQTLEQPNSCDCGVYVGQVVETIFKSPATFWQLAFVSFVSLDYIGSL